MLWLSSLMLAMAEPAANDMEQALRRVTELYAIVERQAADPVTPEQALFGGAIPGMLRRLDPHTVFFDPAQFDQLRQLERSIQKGFGSVVSVLPGRVIMLQTLPNTPSARSGMQPGDEIVAVNQIPLAGFAIEQLVGLLGEARQRAVRLDVRRPGNSRVLQFTLTPEAMDAATVERAFLLEPGVGYVRVGSFDVKTGAQVREAIEMLGGSSLKGLVLDLRNNPGGVLPAALETAALFLKPGQRILTARGRGSEEKQSVDVPAGTVPYGFPVSVLINEKSASASEIVAGALQDHDRATVVGTPSFGKGLVQGVYPLGQGTGLALTTAFYYTPSGRSIQRPLRGGQLGATTAAPADAPRYRTDAGREVRGGGGIEPDAPVRPEPATRFHEVVEATGSFPAFATEVVRRERVDAAFQVSGPLLDQFRLWLSERRIRPSLAEWSAESEWLRSRLLQEVFNLALGVEKGDEVEAQRDPQVRRAREALAAK